jgi:hypothetical protein
MGFAAIGAASPWDRSRWWKPRMRTDAGFTACAPPRRSPVRSPWPTTPFTTDDLARRLSGLKVAARALETDDLAKATVATVLMKLPPLTAEAITKLARVRRIGGYGLTIRGTTPCS